MKLKSYIIFFVSILAALLTFSLVPQTVEAVSYDLIAPTGQLQRGQDVQFTINIDTEGQTLTNATIGMSHKADVLQYVSTTPGEAFPTVNAQVLEGGKIVFTASNPSGFSGKGAFAVVTYKIIATSPGSTQLCVLYNPEIPTPSPILPTELPKTGSVNQTVAGGVIGLTLLILATGAIIFQNRSY